MAPSSTASVVQVLRSFRRVQLEWCRPPPPPPASSSTTRLYSFVTGASTARSPRNMRYNSQRRRFTALSASQPPFRFDSLSTDLSTSTKMHHIRQPCQYFTTLPTDDDNNAKLEDQTSSNGNVASTSTPQSTALQNEYPGPNQPSLSSDDALTKQPSDAKHNVNGTSSTKSKSSNNKKKRNSKRIQSIKKRNRDQNQRISMLKLKSTPTQEEVLHDDFRQLSYRFEPSKFKWLEGLAKELQKQHQHQHQQQQPSKTKSTDKDSPQRKLWKSVLKYLDRRKVPKEMREILFHRIVGSKKAKNPAPNPKQVEQIERDVELLLQARILAVHHPMHWSRESKRKTRKTLGMDKVIRQHPSNHDDNDGETLDQTKPPRLTTDQYLQNVRIPALVVMLESKSAEEQHQDAVEIQKKLQERLPPSQYQHAIKYVQDFVDSCEMNEKGSAQDDAVSSDKTKMTPKEKHSQQELRVIKTNLQRFLPKTRFHFVAQDFADFFHVTVSDSVLHLTEDKHSDLIAEDAIVSASQQEWQETRQAYMQAFQDVQNILINAPNEDATTAVSKEDSILETFDVVAAGASPSKDSQLTTTERVRPRKYIVFEAMKIDRLEETEDGILTNSTTIGITGVQGDMQQAAMSKTLTAPIFPTEPPTKRLVFVDNLPIDIEMDRLTGAFGRCGAIEAVKIFHQRPELDPGRRSTDNRKKIRSPSSSSRRQRWQRPRTPLYGMILYSEAASAAKAVADPLRIFGMVLDHHLIRSQHASAMTSLYLEDVPPSHDTTAIEYDLSRILHPDLYVCLDVSGYRRRQPRRGSQEETLSCMIKFPSFEAAYWAYQKLSAELEYLQEENGFCGLHWMQTPPDAMLYWTRQLNF